MPSPASASTLHPTKRNPLETLLLADDIVLAVIVAAVHIAGLIDNKHMHKYQVITFL